MNKTYYDTISKVSSYLKSEFQIKTLRVFGSCARGEEKEDSDIDIFVDMPPKALKVVELKYYLQDLLHRPVDIVRNRGSLDPFLKSQIQKDGITIF